IGKIIVGLTEASKGNISFNGSPLKDRRNKASKNIYRQIQIVFQDPYSSLNPRMRIGNMLTEGMLIHGIGADKKERMKKAGNLLDIVGLPRVSLRKFPHEFSGGQRQRLSIARALAVEPEFIVADEAVSALDVSIQAQIINLLQDLQQDRRLTMLFIAHDLAVVRHISDRVAVMYLGQIVELAETEELFSEPQHPYTRALLSAVPRLTHDVERKRISLKGEIPSPVNPPSGCAFRTRCPFAIPECSEEEPVLTSVKGSQMKACLRNDLN
ncbi:MAG: peptide ABC transporter ATP-binding protein, partial [Chloroflexota bacterium]